MCQMNNYIYIDSATASIFIGLFILFGVGFCVLSLLLGLAVEKNNWLRERIESLMDKVSKKEQEISYLKSGLPEE